MAKAAKGASSSLFLLMVLGFFALFFVGIDRYGLFDVDEAIFTQASIEMNETNDYVAPTYNGEPRYHKPPLIYWVQSFVLDTFEFSPFFARLPSAIFAFLTIFGFYLFVSGMTKNSRYAMTATAIMGLNLSFVAVSQAATADMALNFFILMGTLTLLANMYARKIDNIAIGLGGFILGLAVLTKGPVALLVPGVAVLWVLLTGGLFFYHLRCVHPVILGVSFLLVIAPWCYFIIDAKGIDFFKEFWLVHNLGRYLDGLGNTHSSSPFYYVGSLMVGFFPWVLLIPGALVWILPKLKMAMRSPDPMDTLPLIGLVWAIAVVVFFSFSATKLPHYILPAIPGFALFIAARLEELPQYHVKPGTLILFVPMILLFTLVFFLLKVLPDALIGEGSRLVLQTMKDLSMAFDFVWPIQDEKTRAVLMQDVHMGIAPVMVGAIILIGLSVALFLMMHGQRKGILVMASTMWMSLVLVLLGVVPAVYAYIQRPLAEIGETIKAEHQEGDRVIFFSIHQPSVRLVSGVPFKAVEGSEALNQEPEISGTTRIVTKEEKLPLIEKVVTQPMDKECKGSYCLLTLAPR